MLNESLKYAEMGLRQLPCIGKKPCLEGWPQRATTDRETLRQWFRGNRRNIAFLTGQENGIVVLDFDDPKMAETLFEAHPDVFRVLMQTRRGFHAYLRHPDVPVPTVTRATVEGATVDVRGERGSILAAPSQVNGFTYRFVPGHELRDIDALPVFPKEWIPRKPEIRVPDRIDGSMDLITRYTNARLWLLRRPPAISGQGGHRQMFGAACNLMRFYRLSPELAWAALTEYNARAEPPFSEKELLHKLNDAMNIAGEPT